MMSSPFRTTSPRRSSMCSGSSCSAIRGAKRRVRARSTSRPTSCISRAGITGTNRASQDSRKRSTVSRRPSTATPGTRPRTSGSHSRISTWDSSNPRRRARCTRKRGKPRGPRWRWILRMGTHIAPSPACWGCTSGTGDEPRRSVALGETGAALDRLDRAYEERAPMLISLPWSPTATPPPPPAPRRAHRPGGSSSRSFPRGRRTRRAGRRSGAAGTGR